MALKPGVPDFNCHLICVCFECGADIVAQALVRDFGYRVQGVGIGDPKAVITEDTVRLIRYCESNWTALTFIDPNSLAISSTLRKIAMNLSTALGVPALLLGISDTAGMAFCELYDTGVKTESLTVDNGAEQHDASANTYEDIDRRVQELGVIPPLFWSPFERIGSPVLSLESIDADWQQIIEAIVLGM
jgi:hypothetical protein